MWGFGVALTALADKLSGRKHSERKRCDVCSKEFNTFEEMEGHRRQEHPETP